MYSEAGAALSQYNDAADFEDLNGGPTEFSPHLKGNIDLTVMTARLLAAK